MFSKNFFGLKIGPSEPVRVMGVLNLSPESFYQPSVVMNYDTVQAKALRFQNEGADLLDLGSKSTAPVDIYGKPNNITPEEEIKRLETPLKAITDLNTKLILSVDTQSAKVAEYALKNGCKIVNDISGFHDPAMVNVIAEYGAAAVIMPAKEHPGDVFTLPDILTALRDSIQKAEKKNIDLSKIILDPGIGGWVSTRRPQHDFDLIKNLKHLRSLGEYCILVAISRKSFIGVILAAPPEERLYGSLAATTVAILNGADIVRTHDVRPTKDTLRIAEKFR